MALRKFLLPAAPAVELRRMLGMAVVSALIAGSFGMVHDEITWSISPEYFTRMKFEQFAAADLGFPTRVFVAEIGFLATWWVGLIAGWFLARVAVPRFSAAAAWRSVIESIGLIIAGTVLMEIAGAWIGPAVFPNAPGWSESLESMGVIDRIAFARVAGIHSAGYLGALSGGIAVVLRLRAGSR